MTYNKFVLEKCELLELHVTRDKVDTFLKQGLHRYSDEEYLYWDKIKYKDIPNGFEDSKELWGFVKFMRNLNYIAPIKTNEGENFKFGELSFSKKLLHKVDKNISGTSYIPSDSYKKIFIANGMLEEAISSSQLEGAATTTKNAMKMIQEGRKPVSNGEKMIMNNYNAMLYIKNELINKKLEKSDLLYLQSILTKDTLEKGDEEGRFRTNNDDIIVEFEGKIAHQPMPEERLHEEIDRLIDFVNDNSEDGIFVHPIIKAIILHFWIGYLHPFCDGNGRTARALFYWYLLRNEYFGFSYLPLSSVIKNSKKDYARSYIYSEQDDLDLTYFINYNLRKIQIASDKFEQQVKDKFKEHRNELKNLHHLDLNERQKKLINYFMNNNESYTNYMLHKNYYNIAPATAISDLKGLERKGYIFSVKSGRNVSYYPVDNLEEVIKKDQI